MVSSVFCSVVLVFLGCGVCVCVWVQTFLNRPDLLMIISNHHTCYRAALGLGKGDKGEGEDGEGEEEGDGEGEEGLVIQEEDKANVVKRKKGAWSTV